MQPPTPPREEEGKSDDTGEQPEDFPGVDFSDKLRSACFLDNKGRILTDSLLWKIDDTHYYVDVPENTADTLIKHLKQFILRRTNVKVKDESETMSSHVVFGTLNAHGTPEGYMAAMDPRHPSLGMRVLSTSPEYETQFTNMMSGQFPDMPGTYQLIRKLAGVAEGMELQGRVAAEANQEFLNAVSFSKGCYLGQELTARVQYTGAVRKRILPLFMVNVNMQVPRPWLMASQLQAKSAAKVKEAEGSDDEEEKKQADRNENQTPADAPRLPRLSAAAAGSMVAMMSGSAPRLDDSEGHSPATSSEHEEMRAQSEALFEQLQSYKTGDKIYDSKDGKTIGQIVATPAEGTNVLLAQMRLDRVGLLGNDTAWSHTNKVTIGDNAESVGGSPLRYLPYLPLWWPPINPETGKAK
jgi:folate-binding protein YgfZ